MEQKTHLKQRNIRFLALILFSITLFSQDLLSNNIDLLHSHRDNLEYQYHYKKIINNALKSVPQTYNDVYFGIDKTQKLAELFRLEKARRKLQKIFGKKISNLDLVPKIAIACSGGGFRATTTTLALLQFLEDLDLLDLPMYIAGVSGSTWTISSWIKHGISTYELENKIIRPAICHSSNTKEMIYYLWKAFKEIDSSRAHESLGLEPEDLNLARYPNFVDFWGKFLAKKFFHSPENPKGIAYLSELTENFTGNNIFPIPLLAAVVANKSFHCGYDYCNYQWIEFSPLGIHIPNFTSWIKPSKFGYLFDDGQIKTDFGSEETLGYLIGICGSAMAINLRDAMKNDSSVQKWFKKHPVMGKIIKMLLGKKRFAKPQVPNFLYKINNLKHNIAHEKYLTLVDGGVSNNIPFPLLMHKDIDVYIVINSNIGEEAEMAPITRARNYAKLHGFQFPRFNYKKIKNKSFSIIIDKKNKKAPIVIYIQNPVKVSTFKLDYTEEEFDKVLHQTKDNLYKEKNINKIIKTLSKAIKRKRNTVYAYGGTIYR